MPRKLMLEFKKIQVQTKNLIKNKIGSNANAIQLIK